MGLLALLLMLQSLGARILPDGGSGTHPVSTGWTAVLEGILPVGQTMRLLALLPLESRL
jgi:hypothetical protein